MSFNVQILETRLMCSYNSGRDANNRNWRDRPSTSATAGSVRAAPKSRIQSDVIDRWNEAASSAKRDNVSLISRGSSSRQLCCLEHFTRVSFLMLANQTL